MFGFLTLVCFSVCLGDPCFFFVIESNLTEVGDLTASLDFDFSVEHKYFNFNTIYLNQIIILYDLKNIYRLEVQYLSPQFGQSTHH